jgi:hypothetical protein
MIEMTTKLQLYITTPISSSSSAIPSESSTVEIRGRSAGQGCEIRWKVLSKKAGTNFNNALERKRKNRKQSDEALSAQGSCQGVTGKSMPPQLLDEASVRGVAEGMSEHGAAHSPRRLPGWWSRYQRA